MGLRWSHLEAEGADALDGPLAVDPLAHEASGVAVAGAASELPGAHHIGAAAAALHSDLCLHLWGEEKMQNYCG